MKPFDYSAPGRLDDAVALLARTPGARVLAGGSHLLVEPSRSALDAPLLVDLRRVDGLAGVESGAAGVRIGAMVTAAALAAHDALTGPYAALAEAAAQIGDPQVRNRATVGGALATGDPAADLPAALLALDAQVEVAGPQGRRTAPVASVLGALDRSEVVTAVTLPAASGRAGSAYEKIRHPATFYALCGVAASLTLDAGGVVQSCRITVTGAAAPSRAVAAEAAVAGRIPTAAAIEAASARVTEGLALNGDAFGSPEYRGHLAKVLAGRALARAVARAGQGR